MLVVSRSENRLRVSQGVQIEFVGQIKQKLAPSCLIISRDRESQPAVRPLKSCPTPKLNPNVPTLETKAMTALELVNKVFPSGMAFILKCPNPQRCSVPDLAS